MECSIPWDFLASIIIVYYFSSILQLKLTRCVLLVLMGLKFGEFANEYFGRRKFGEFTQNVDSVRILVQFWQIKV